MKIIVTRGQGYRMGVSETEATIVVYGRLLGTYFSKDRGLRLKTSSVRRNPPQCLDPRIKTLNYLNNILSRLEAFSSGCDDSLQLNLDGFVSESTCANIFIIKDGVLKTPRKYNVLEGITRNLVIEIADKIGYDVLEDDFTLYDVYNADEVFLCGSAAEITPVAEVDGRKIVGSGEITKKIQQMYNELSHK
jgi:branched-chain amino acid aminotransferase